MLVLLRRLVLGQHHWRRLVSLVLVSATLWGSVLGMVLPGTALDSTPAGTAGKKAKTETETGAGPPTGANGKTEETPAGLEKRLEPTVEEVQLLARTVYSEARGEHFTGQVAVAAVVLNRVEDPHFPDDVTGVIFEPDAFTAVSDGQFWLEPDREAYRAVESALEGTDPTCGAVYYYNPATATSPWIYGRRVIKQIGRHRFAA